MVQRGVSRRSLHEARLSVVVGVNARVQLGLHLAGGGSAGVAGRALLKLVLELAGGGAGSGSVGVGGGASKSAANGLGLALETVVTLLATGQDTTLLLEVGHADGRESRGRVNLGGVVVNLVDGNGGVDNGGLDGF